MSICRDTCTQTPADGGREHAAVRVLHRFGSKRGTKRFQCTVRGGHRRRRARVSNATQQDGVAWLAAASTRMASRDGFTTTPLASYERDPVNRGIDSIWTARHHASAESRGIQDVIVSADDT